MNIRTLHELVREEAAKLREFATKEELEKLNLRRLNANSTSNCIYGQLTGNCLSQRANELIFQCCTIGYDIELDDQIEMPNEVWNGTDRYYSYNAFFSPIERYLVSVQEDGVCVKSAGLIAYLKGEIEIIEL